MSYTAVSYLKLQRAALLFLDQTGSFGSICSQCSLQNKCGRSPKTFHFTVTVDPSELVDLNTTLGNAFLNHPMAATKVFQEVVFAMIETLDLLPTCTSLTQVVVNLKATHLPSLPSYELSSSRCLTTSCSEPRLLQYRGVICSISTLHSYTKSARFVCGIDGCPGSEGDHFIRVHIPGATETQTIRKDFRCSFCCSLLEEDISSRVLADKIIVYIMDCQAFHQHGISDCQRYQALTALLRDELCGGIEIGQEVTVIGIPVHDSTQASLHLEVNNIIQMKQHCPPRPERPLDITCLPESLQYLYQDRGSSPWSFNLSLAYAFGSGVTAAGSFLHLKLGILLSLLSNSQSQGMRGLDLLAVGRDTLLVHRLLQYGASLSPRYIHHTATSPLTATLTKTTLPANSTIIHGGSLLLAQGGVCLLPDLSTAKRSFKQTLSQVLETSRVCVEVGGRMKSEGCGNHVMYFPLHCQVWAVSDISTQHQKPQHSRVGGGGVEACPLQDDPLQLDPQLDSMFGMVYFWSLVSDTYPDYMMTHHTLLTATGCHSTPLISHQNFKQLLELARQYTVSLSSEAECLIKGYYVASRRARAASIHQTTLPQTAVATISRLACSHAKLRLASSVSEEDAVIAVLLYEESATLRFGSSPLNVKPLEHIQDNNLQSYIGPERDLKLRVFQKQLKQFISVYAGDVTMEE